MGVTVIDKSKGYFGCEEKAKAFLAQINSGKWGNAACFVAIDGEIHVVTDQGAAMENTGYHEKILGVATSLAYRLGLAATRISEGFKRVSYTFSSF